MNDQQLAAKRAVLTDDQLWDIRNRVAIKEVTREDDSKTICVKHGRAIETAILAALAKREPYGDVVITTDSNDQCVAVTRQDEEGRILSVIWTASQRDSVAEGEVAQACKHLWNSNDSYYVHIGNLLECTESARLAAEDQAIAAKNEIYESSERKRKQIAALQAKLAAERARANALSSIGFQLTAKLCQLHEDDSGRLLREDVMGLIVAWRSKVDAANASCPSSKESGE